MLAAPRRLESFALELGCWTIQLFHGLNVKLRGAGTISWSNFAPNPSLTHQSKTQPPQGLNLACLGKILHWEQRCITGIDRSQHIPIRVSLHHGISKKSQLSRLMGMGPVKAFQPAPPGLLWELEPRWSEQITAASRVIHPGHFGRPEFPPNDKNKQNLSALNAGKTMKKLGTQ